MSGPKHSPAPWWYDEGHCAIRYQLPPRHPDRYSDDPELDDGARNVVSLIGACGGTDTAADVAVMTAGPELLAALYAVLPLAESRLEDMREACDAARGTSSWDEANDLVMKAAAAFAEAIGAIAAAEGRA